MCLVCISSLQFSISDKHCLRLCCMGNIAPKSGLEMKYSTRHASCYIFLSPTLFHAIFPRQHSWKCFIYYIYMHMCCRYAQAFVPSDLTMFSCLNSLWYHIGGVELRGCAIEKEGTYQKEAGGRTQ